MFGDLFSNPDFINFMQGIISSELSPEQLALSTMANLLGITDMTPEEFGEKTIGEVLSHMGLEANDMRLNQVASVLNIERAKMDSMSLKELIGEIFQKDPQTMVNIMSQILGPNG